MSAAKFNQWLNSDGSENYKCRAWVNFDGTGTPAIRASGNVSSITDVSVANYEVNLTTAMPDADYCAIATAQLGNQTGYSNYYSYSGYNVSASKYRFVWYSNDSAQVNVAIFR